MDTVTQTLVGVALARAGVRRITPQATLLLILAVNLPDIDVLALSRGQLAYLEIHRGYTDTFLALPVLALIAVGLAALFGRAKLSLMRAWGVACLGVGCHLLLDWTNSFGIRPLLPFSARWFYLDLNGLYDGIMLTALALALAWPWFAGLVSSEIAGGRVKFKGQGSAIAVLLFLLLFEGARWSLHQRALNQLNSRLYDGEIPVNIAALPDPNNPLEWMGVVETQAAFRSVKTGTLDISASNDARVFFKPPQTAAYRVVTQSEPFRYMAYFARFPVWGFDPVALDGGMGTSVDLTDLRFGTPGTGYVHATALLDSKGRLLDSGFRIGSKKPTLPLADR